MTQPRCHLHPHLHLPSSLPKTSKCLQFKHTSCTHVPLTLVIAGASEGTGSAGPECGLRDGSDSVQIRFRLVHAELKSKE